MYTSFLPTSYPTAIQVTLCQKWLQSKQSLIVEACSSPTTAFHLSRILVLCAHTLYHAPQQPLAVPLRMLEVFLSPQSYMHTYSAQQTVANSSGRLLERLNTHLVANGEQRMK